MRRIAFLEASSMREQFHIACEELRGPDDMRITFDPTVSFLGLTHQAVFNHPHRPIHVTPVGRPKCFPPEAYEMISAMITEHFAWEGIILSLCGWTANVRRKSGLEVGKSPRRWMLVKEETGGYNPGHSKIHITLISFLLTIFSQLFNEIS
jgi:hypothetical protein